MATRAKAAAPAKRLTIKIEDLADFDESKNILIVGDSGAGKTVLAGGAPSLLFLSTENGTISAKRQGSKAKLIRLKNWGQIEEALDMLEASIEAGTCKFKWVCLDSLPKMQVMLRQHLLNIGIEEQRKGADEDSLQLQDYNKWYNMFQRFVDRLVDMPINVIFTSTSMRIEAEDDDGAPMDIVLPAIQGKAKEGYALAQNVCAAMSSVWFLNIEGKGDKRRRVLYTQRRPPYFAKCRYGVLPARLVLAPNDPTTMARLISMIEDGDPIEEDAPEVEEELDDELEGEEPEPEPAPKPTRATRATRAKKPEPEPEPEDEEPDYDDDEEEEDEEPEPPKKTRTATRKPATRQAAAKPATSTRATRKKVEEEEEDLSDLDDLDDLDDDEDY